MQSKSLVQSVVFLTALTLMPLPAFAAPRLVVNDSIIASESAPVIVSGRLLVPARVVSEQLGAQVKWLKNKNAVQITKSKTVIELVVGAKQAKVSGKTLKIDSPVQIIHNRVYVPVRFIGESLGATVSWDKKSETARIAAKTQPTPAAPVPKPAKPVPPVVVPSAPDEDIPPADTPTAPAITVPIAPSVPAPAKLPDGTVMLTTANAEANSAGVNMYLWGDSKFATKITKEDATGITAEISGAYLVQGAKEIKINKSGISSIFFEQVSVDNPLVRVRIVSTSGKLPYTQKSSAKGDTIAISVPNRVMSVDKTSIAGQEVFSIKTSGPLEIASHQASDNTYIVELPYTVSDLKENNIVPTSNMVSKIDVEQIGTATKATTRVTFTLNNSRSGRISIGTAAAGIIVDFSPRLALAELTQGKTSTTLKLAADDILEGNYRISYIDKGIAIDFPFMTSGLKDDIIQAAGSVTACRVVKNPLVPKGFRLELDLPIRAKYNTSFSADGKTLNLEILTAPAAIVPVLNSKKIIIDAGHGGKDSGAVATNGAYEKDYNLAIANLLFQKLNAAGSQVMMTRYDDTYLTLQQRTDMANNNGEDIFISIHQNSNGNPAVSGTESYYYSNPGKSQKLAALMASKVSAAIGTSNRGAKSHMFFVVNHTKMPSALLETDFISNPTENARVRDPAFQDTVAQALYEAIAAYELL